MSAGTPLLVVLSGLPGVGKTTAARSVASRLGAAFLRIDDIEQAVMGALQAEVGAAGYAVANAVAESNLRLGLCVVADAVSPVEASRAGWRAVARRTGARILQVELVCSDPPSHRARVEGRSADISGHAPPSWDDVRRLAYDPWIEPRLVVDTAALSPAEVADAVMEAARSARDA